MMIDDMNLYTAGALIGGIVAIMILPLAYFVYKKWYKEDSKK